MPCKHVGSREAQLGTFQTARSDVLSVCFAEARPEMNPLVVAPALCCSQVVGFRAPNFRINNLMGEVLADLQFE